MFSTLIGRAYIRGGRERNKYRTLNITLKTCDKEKLPLYRQIIGE